MILATYLQWYRLFCIYSMRQRHFWGIGPSLINTYVLTDNIKNFHCYNHIKIKNECLGNTPGHGDPQSAMNIHRLIYIITGVYSGYPNYAESKRYMVWVPHKASTLTTSTVWKLNICTSKVELSVVRSKYLNDFDSWEHEMYKLGGSASGSGWCAGGPKSCYPSCPNCPNE